jgi:DNA-binding MarR family transcriptional regulator
MAERENKTDGAAVMQHLSVAFLTWRRYLQRRMVPYNITLKQLYVLGQLEKRAFLYPSQIAEMLFCDRPTATVVIKNMEKHGWVERQRDPQDRRQMRIMVTGQGRDKLAEIKRSRPASLVDPLACFSAEEIGELDRLLARLNQHLEKTKKEKRRACVDERDL